MDINLKSINEILNFHFNIPSYQRGYRWTKNQVIDLLEDIYDFIQKKEKKVEDVGDFYCLQPIIVKKETDKKYRLIDGQQRLITIYIILSFLEKKKFLIEFETREKSKIFLEKISDEINKENIDFYHISKAFCYIKEWFLELEEKEATIREEFYINLGKYTKIIWYEIDIDEDEIDVFTRINSGKIPLTNAELIKALFLNSKNFESPEKNLRQIEISKEWDEIEYTLQNNEFWYFLTINKEYSTRIELLFELFTEKTFFDEFTTYKYFSKIKQITNIWADDEENIKKVFLSLKYWFDNRKLFHLIGFLIATKKVDLKSLYSEFKDKKKTEFEKYLIDKIKNEIQLEKLNELDYDNDYDMIFKTLLLFNIASILNNSSSYIRFAFDKFYKENWTLEHIHARNDKGFNKSENVKNWLLDVKAQIEKISNNEEVNVIIQKINDLITNGIFDNEDQSFQNIEKEIYDYFGNPDINTIDNLALLPNEINISLSNNIFPLKRNILINKDKTGEFIPICTKNVFLKYYSKNADNLLFWNNNDRVEYLENIKLIINNFIENE